MNKELLSALLWFLKDILVYFERTNRHLYRYNGVEICKKIFLKSIEDKHALYLFLYCCDEGFHKLCKIFLEDPRIDPSNTTALWRACRNNHPKTAQLLLQDKRNNYGDLLSVLLQDKRFDPGYDNNICISSVSKNNNIKIVKLFLEDTRVDPSARNNEAIYQAAKNNYYKIVKLLSKDPRVDTQRALEIAQERGHTEIVHLLTKKKIKK